MIYMQSKTGTRRVACFSARVTSMQPRPAGWLSVLAWSFIDYIVGRPQVAVRHTGQTGPPAERGRDGCESVCRSRSRSAQSEARFKAWPKRRTGARQGMNIDYKSPVPEEPSEVQKLFWTNNFCGSVKPFQQSRLRFYHCARAAMAADGMQGSPMMRQLTSSGASSNQKTYEKVGILNEKARA